MDATTKLSMLGYFNKKGRYYLIDRKTRKEQIQT